MKSFPSQAFQPKDDAKWVGGAQGVAEASARQMNRSPRLWGATIVLLTVVASLAAVESAEAQWNYPPQVFANSMRRQALHPYQWAAMASRSAYGISTSSCQPSRNHLYGNSWSDSHARELSRAETYYEKKRIRQRYLDEQNARKMRTTEDVAALREHYDSVQAILDIKRQMAADRSRAAMAALNGETKATRSTRSVGEIGSIRLAAIHGTTHVSHVSAALDHNVWDAPLSSAVEPACAWVSADGQRHFEAELIQCQHGIVMLKRADNGDIVRLPVSDLHPVSQRALITGIQWGRVWRDCTKSHAAVARMLSCEHEKVVLLKPDGSLLHVALAALSAEDQAFATSAAEDKRRPSLLAGGPRHLETLSMRRSTK